MELKNKVAIITGASTGIGQAIAMGLAHEGARIVLASRNQEALEAIAGEIKKQGAEVLVVPTDVTQDSQLKSLVEQTVDAFGGIHILVNNAGVYQRALVEEITEETLEYLLRVNLMAPFLLTAHALPHLKKSGEGAVINMSSLAGTMGFAKGSSYSASKHGLLGFSDSLFEEVREFGIKVCAICPGFVRTPMVENYPYLDPDKMIPPEDIAKTVTDFLHLSIRSAPTRMIIRPQFSPYRSKGS